MSDQTEGREVDEHLAKDVGLPGAGDDTADHLSEDASVAPEAIEGDDADPGLPASFATGGFMPPGLE